jgi:chromosome segregation ATPase
MGISEDKALDDLYLADLEDFIAGRDEVAKLLRAGGDGTAADRVKALRKPSRAAWAINRFGAEEPKLTKELLAAGAALRKAQERLVAGKADRAEVRAATERERDAVDKARDAAAGIAADAGAKLSPAALERVGHTLHAVALDDHVRRDFERRRLSTDHEAVGLGGFDFSAAPAAKSGRKAARRGGGESKQAARGRAELKAAEQRVRELERRQKQADLSATAARAVAERAQRDLQHATKELKEATGAVAEAKERAEALRRR